MDKIERILTRGVTNIVPSKDGLEKVLRLGKKLNVYLGIDPTATKIHLGHAIALRKLEEFAKLGHNVTFLIGDFTALVGDTSDKDSERPILTPEEIEANFKTYKKQAEKILDFSKVKIRFNSEWLNKLNPKDFIRLCIQFSLNDFISRELIRKRLDAKTRVGLHEVLYPALQGYDSYFLDTDIQIGGTDQTFNMQAGRTLQKLWRKKESFILSTEFLTGTDERKMSKSWGNAIWLTDNPNDMYAKVMAINDDLIIQYFTLGTRFSNEEIEKIKVSLDRGENPINIKKELAKIIVTELHNANEASKAKENFEKTVQKKETPIDIPIFKIPQSLRSGATITDVLVSSGLTSSKAEAKRVTEQGGTAINNEIITNPNEPFIPKENSIIRVGKRKFVKIKT